MDDIKCKTLKAQLAAEPEPHLVSADRFFDGNDDAGSIGCNLPDHPGVATFREVFAALRRRPDVQAVYARISELDPGEGCWPFTDTILVVGTISADDLRAAVKQLHPSDIGPAEDYGVPPTVSQKHGAPVLAIWWD